MAEKWIGVTGIWRLTMLWHNEIILKILLELDKVLLTVKKKQCIFYNFHTCDQKYSYFILHLLFN